MRQPKHTIFATALEVAKTVAPLVSYGPQGVAAATAVLTLIDSIHDAVSASPAELAIYAEAREDLERAVNEHADRTAASLG